MDDGLDCNMGVRIPYKMKRRLNELHASRNLNVSEFIRDAIAERLNNLHAVKLDEFVGPAQQEVKPQVKEITETQRRMLRFDHLSLIKEGKTPAEAEELLAARYPDLVAIIKGVPLD